MSDHVLDRLDDYLDGLLPDGEAAGVSAHIASCASCAAAETGLRTLLSAASALPRSIDPPAEVWAAVRAQTMAARPNRAAMFWSLRYPLAAAAVTLIVITSIATMLLTQRPQSVVLSPSAAATLTALAEAEREYQSVTAGLERVLQQRQGDVDPATLQVVRQNLHIIDRAITDARAALERNPRDMELPRLISTSYQRKIDMLERTLRLSAKL